MTLARPVVLPDRMVLVGTGAVLTEAMITQLLKRGIMRIVVSGQPVERQNAGDFAARLAALESRFSRVNHLPLMRALSEVIARHLAKRF